MAKLNCVFILGIVAVGIGFVSAVSDEEKAAIRLAAIPVITACGIEHGITKEDIMAAKESKDINALNPCFYACFFKKTGSMNSEGLFDAASARENRRKFVHGEEDLKKLDEISEKCAAVNEHTVSDGAKGCERAKLLVQCFKENKGAFSPLSS